MNPITLTAEPRTELGKKSKHLRKEGRIPGSIYCHGESSVLVTLSASEFQHAYRRAGASGIVELRTGGSAPTRVLFHHVDRDPISHQPLNVAMLQVRMNEKVAVEVPIRVHGEAPAAKHLGATIVTERDHVKIEGLPADLPQHLDIDLSSLNTLDDKITAADLRLPSGISLLTHAEDILVTVVAPAKPEPEPVYEEPAEAEPEEAGSETEGSEG